MRKLQTPLAIFCALLVACTPLLPQQADNPRMPRLETGNQHWYSGITEPYRARVVPPVNVSNSSRLDSLLRAGNLYLSLRDAIALAVENNLDVEIQRYEFSLAEADLLRARTGASTFGIPTNVLAGVPTGAGQILGSVNTGLAAGGQASPLLGPNAAGQTGVAFGAGNSFDPVLTGTLNFGHLTQPQSNTVTSGTSALVTTNKTANFAISQTYVTGTTASLGFNNIDQAQNSFRNTVNPVTTSNLDLTVVQPLLNGFGIAVNNRTIRIARNNIRAADHVFEQQLINTVANVVQLYWNLVSSVQQVEVRKQAVAVSQKLYEDNKKQVEIGTLAPIEIVRAEAQVASNQQALVAAESTVSQFETVLKSALSRNGLASPNVMDARIIPTDVIRIPETEAIQPIQDLIGKALESRPDLAQSRIQIENSEIALTGTRAAMLPTLNVFANARNNGLAGPQNTITGPPNSNGVVQQPSLADPFFVGGYGNVLSQLFLRNFPNYSIGFNFNIPLRNRTAQANLATATVQLRQSQLQVQRQINQIRVDVQNALIGVNQARAQYQAAVQGRILQEQTLDADQKKLALGATTPYQVIQDQRDLTTAAASEVSAQAAYASARVQLDVATGQILSANNVVLDEAKAARVSAAPSPLPPLDAPR